MHMECMCVCVRICTNYIYIDVYIVYDVCLMICYTYLFILAFALLYVPDFVVSMCLNIFIWIICFVVYICICAYIFA